MDFTIAAEGGDNIGHNGGDRHLKPWLIMVVVQLFNAVSNLLFKKILNGGCFIVPTLTYRNIIAALSVTPLAIFYEREAWKDLTWEGRFYFVLYTFPIALCQVTLALLSLYYGMRETTAALSSNVMNITPIMTFMIVVLARKERLNLGSRTGNLKVLGALVCIGGVILSMIKYPKVHSWYGVYSLLGAGTATAVGQSLQGILYGASSAKYSITTLTCLFGSLQTAVIGVFVNTYTDDWTLKSDMQFFTVFYSGFLNTAAAYFMISWVIPRRGYIYPSMFNSFSVFVTAVVECQMGEHTSFRSFLGMLIIIGGLHLHLWAKDYEEQAGHSCVSTHVCESREPEDIPDESTSGSLHSLSETLGSLHSLSETLGSLHSLDSNVVPDSHSRLSDSGSLHSLDSDVVPDPHPRLPDSGIGEEEYPEVYGPDGIYFGVGPVFKDEEYPEMYGPGGIYSCAGPVSEDEIIQEEYLYQ